MKQLRSLTIVGACHQVRRGSAAFGRLGDVRAGISAIVRRWELVIGRGSPVGGRYRSRTASRGRLPARCCPTPFRHGRLLRPGKLAVGRSALDEICRPFRVLGASVGHAGAPAAIRGIGLRSRKAPPRGETLAPAWRGPRQAISSPNPVATGGCEELKAYPDAGWRELTQVKGTRFLFCRRHGSSA
jgi:hypothetical protein